MSISYGLFEDCPICDSKLVDRKCKNGCFEDHKIYIKIFDMNIYLNEIENVNVITKLIKHWKENERYLTKFMLSE